MECKNIKVIFGFSIILAFAGLVEKASAFNFTIRVHKDVRPIIVLHIFGKEVGDLMQGKKSDTEEHPAWKGTLLQHANNYNGSLKVGNGEKILKFEDTRSSTCFDLDATKISDGSGNPLKPIMVTAAQAEQIVAGVDTFKQTRDLSKSIGAAGNDIKLKAAVLVRKTLSDIVNMIAEKDEVDTCQDVDIDIITDPTNRKLIALRRI